MGKVRFMVFSGFLGAGKTTTMIALAEQVNRTYGEMALIANDLGAELVDTGLTKASGCTVVEVGSGCICYQMDNTIGHIRRFRDKHDAVLVASDIPGCGVGALDHVYRLLADEYADEFTLAPFTVVADPERLRMIMPEHADINLPEELVYLLKLQLEEADLVVLNKRDLLSDEDVERYLDFLRAACPDVPVIAISARERTNIGELADFVMTHTSALRSMAPLNRQEFDDAEAKLTWYNRRIYLKAKGGAAVDMNEVVDELIEGIRMRLIERKRNVPHLKTFATAGDGSGDFSKASLIGVDYDTEYEQRFEQPRESIRMIVNARAVCESRALARLMDDALDEVLESHDLDCQVFFTECFGMRDEGR